MGVKIRKLRGKWYLVIDHQGKRKKRAIGHDYKIADEVRRQVEAKLALGDFSLLEDRQPEPEFTFQQYSDRWLTEYAELELKPSSVIKHRQVLRLYLLPKFGQQSLSSISRDDIKSFLASLAKPANSASRRSLSRNSLRLIVCTLRVILNHAQEDGKIDSNPARKLGRFTKIDKADQQKKATALSREEAERFLLSAQEVCPKFYPLFLTALRAGLRHGELIALEWGDIQFGASEQDSNRYILVQHNWVNGRLTSPENRKSRRVDMSRQLRVVLIELRDERMLEAFLNGKKNIADDLVFPSEVGTVLQPENLYHRYFLPILEHARLRRIRLHDLRHTFGSQLIQRGASLTYVKEQMGHSSIQVTVDIYGHLIPGADISCIDQLDTPTTKSAHTPHTLNRVSTGISLQVVDLIGGPGGIRTPDQGIMSPLL